MGIIAAIVALLKAVPSLERLFLAVAKSLKESRAEAIHEEELKHIDDAIAAARGGVQDSRVSRFEWSEDFDRSPPVSDSSKDGSGVHTISLEGSGSSEQDNKK